VWQQQCFNASALRTSDGKIVEILSPGDPNTDGGPDFLNARIRVGEVTYYGDVELHRDARSWAEHHHEADSHYNRIILHVVLTAESIPPQVRTKSGRAVPLLVLHPFLDETLLGTLSTSLFADQGTEGRPIRCRDVNDTVPVEAMLTWIEKLAWERIELKVRRFEERLKQLIDEERQPVREPHPQYFGNPDEIPVPHKSYTRIDFAARKHWEQLLYEGIMEGLGFSKNRTPFLALAQSVRLEVLRQQGLTDTEAMMGILFGAAGLLPSTRTLADPEARKYVRTLRKRWSTFRPTYKGRILNGADWLFFRLRPANFPTARLAAFCFLLPTLFGKDTLKILVAAFKNADPPRRIIRNLCSVFSFEPDEFWQCHYHFEERTTAPAVRLGHSKQLDLIINVLLPVVMLYARVFNDQDLRSNAREVLSRVPGSQRNAFIRKMERELIKGKTKTHYALQEQGLMQLYRFYCSPGRCTECAVGERVPWLNNPNS